jgi:hypothetical protein
MQMDVSLIGLENVDWMARNHVAIARNALNITLKSLRTLSGDVVVERYNIGVNKVKSSSNIRVDQARGSSLVGRMVATAAPIPLIDFKAKQTDLGIEVVIKKGGQTFDYPHMFIAQMPSGHRGVFLRKGEPRRMKSGMYVGRTRQPIKEQFAKGTVASFMSSTDVWSKLEIFAKERITVEIKKEYDKFIHGVGRYSIS